MKSATIFSLTGTLVIMGVALALPQDSPAAEEIFYGGY